MRLNALTFCGLPTKADETISDDQIEVTDAEGLVLGMIVKLKIPTF